MNRAKLFAAFSILSLVFLSSLCQAQQSPEELAKETELACEATAKTKPTPQMIIDKVTEACDLLQKEGTAAFPKFKGKDSPFLFAGTYIWIHDMNCVMRMHPIKYKMEGKTLVDFKDSNQKRFFIDMNNVAKEKGAGWVDYTWPKPGEKEPSVKISYVKLVKVGTEELVVGCGVYDLPDAEMKKLLAQ